MLIPPVRVLSPYIIGWLFCSFQFGSFASFGPLLLKVLAWFKILKSRSSGGKQPRFLQIALKYRGILLFLKKHSERNSILDAPPTPICVLVILIIPHLFPISQLQLPKFHSSPNPLWISDNSLMMFFSKALNYVFHAHFSGLTWCAITWSYSWLPLFKNQDQNNTINW